MPSPPVHRPSVPITPQPLHVLQGRYHAAVQELIPALEVQPMGHRPPPSKNPVHVFDTLDGIRLIISRELYPNHTRAVHFSASFNTPALAARPIVELMEWITATWQAIAQSTATPQLVKISDGGVPHFIVEQVN